MDGWAWHLSREIRSSNLQQGTRAETVVRSRRPDELRNWEGSGVAIPQLGRDNHLVSSEKLFNALYQSEHSHRGVDADKRELLAGQW